jgi:NADPH:quinone reductase-like Zn-dependent oxidoreductase
MCQDIAVATGRYDETNFSLDCSGVVHNVGSAVRDFQPGDLVWGFAPGNFGNFVRVPAIFLQKMAPTDSFASRAALPVSYLTAIYALMHLAQLSKGETVLIQSATGGLGTAALRIARHLGAEIYATAGTPEKVKFLIDNFGIDADHIFSSRELSATAKIMKATGDKGIDVILCSAAGEQMHETWRCIAPMGRFIEVGRTNVLNHGSLSMEIFQRNATFSSFDIELLFKQKPLFGAR